MPIYVSLTASWSDLYSDDELAQIHAALLLDEAQDATEFSSTIPHDWEALIAGRCDEQPWPPWFHVPYDESQGFLAALDVLCDQSASAASRLEFFPDYLYAPMDLPDPADPPRRWRLYSSEVMALRWLTIAKIHEESTRLARLYRWRRGWCDREEYEQLQAEYGEEYPIGDRLEEQRRTRAYYIVRLGDLADKSRRSNVPGFVRW